MDVLHWVFGGWYAEPVPLVAAAAAVLLYAIGARRLAATAPGRGPSRTQQVYLGAGITVILVALLSPIDGLALQLQWVHMLQHVLLLVVAPPLVVLARPWETGLAALPPRLRSALRWPQSVVTSTPRRVVASAGAVLVFVAVMWVWHIPALYDLTLRDDLVHNLEHTAFLAVGLLFWTAALPRADTRAPLGMVGQSAVVLGGLVGSWLLAVYIGYASGVLYAYSGTASISALADQQLAAGVMWVPASVPFVIAIVWIMARWFENDARLADAEARRPAEVRA